MSNNETERLAKSGWKSKSAAELLWLVPEKEAIVETGLILSRLVRETREATGGHNDLPNILVRSSHR